MWTQSQSGQEILIVEYADCKLTLLPSCGLKGSYTFTQTDRIRVEEFILNKNDLFTKLPFDAMGLEPEFKPEGIWSLQTVKVGTYDTLPKSVGRAQLAKKCARATHFVKRIDVGAYYLQTKNTTGKTTAKKIVKKGGVYERCLLSITEARNPVCQSVLRMDLVPVLGGEALPLSAPHQLLKQLPGTERCRRAELNHMGETVVLPAPHKVNIVVFWAPYQGDDPSDDNAREVLSELDQIWQKANKTQVQMVGVAMDIDALELRHKLQNLSITFPVINDSQTGKIKTRYQVSEPLPAIFVIDKSGYVQFFTNREHLDIKKVEAAVQALQGK